MAQHYCQLPQDKRLSQDDLPLGASARWLGQDKMLMLRSGYAEVKLRAVASESESRSQG